MRIHGCMITIIMLVGGAASAQEPKGWLGVVEQVDVTKVAADKIGLNASQGVKVGYVVPGSPADKAGLKAGDYEPLFQRAIAITEKALGEGSFTMGSPANEPERSNGEVQVHVTIPAAFAVGMPTSGARLGGLLLERADA